jgi:hypothetical protein
MKPLVVAITLVVMWSAALIAQDAVKALPANYRIEFENDSVRVTRVHYGPYAKLPAHTHTSLPSAYVYLNDSGPVAFKHVGAEYGAVTRPATVAGSFRLFRGIEEIHLVENLSAKPSDFLRVEFKTDPVDPRSLRGKFMPEPGDAATEKVEFENAQLRVTRLRAPAGRPIHIPAAAQPGVLISVTGPDAGKATWVPMGQVHTVTAASATRSEVLRFELKTAVKRPTG